jgi:hypothetical protein
MALLNEMKRPLANVKDLIALAKMKEAEPIDPGTFDRQQLNAMGIVEDGNGNDHSWVRPRRLFALTGVPDASHEIVWVTNKLRRTKRKVVRFSSSDNGAIEQILIRKKAI